MSAALFEQREMLPKVSRFWHLTRDGDPYVYEMARRHYSARNYLIQRQRLFMGPGRKIVLITGDGAAAFCWRLGLNDIQPPQEGWLCTMFRNEGHELSSSLIMDAVRYLWQREGPVRCWTLVDGGKVRSSNPGCCFKKAGWNAVGKSKTGKVILTLEP